MRYQIKRLQRGQAMSEFIAAMALFIPIIFGVIYLGKFEDIKHQAIQASRYAAMERALDPRAHEENDTIVQNETVARFFRDNGQHTVGYKDLAQGATATDENTNWNTAAGDPLLKQYSDVSVRFNQKTANSFSSHFLTSNPGTHQFANLQAGFGDEADVSVSVGSIAHFLFFLPATTITASTVMAGDAWNGGGSQDVADHFTMTSVVGMQPDFTAVQLGLEGLTSLLSDSGPPQFGCVKPDVVPDSATAGSKYDPMDDPTHPKNPNNGCLQPSILSGLPQL